MFWGKHSMYYIVKYYIVKYYMVKYYIVKYSVEKSILLTLPSLHAKTPKCHVTLPTEHCEETVPGGVDTLIWECRQKGTNLGSN